MKVEIDGKEFVEKNKDSNSGNHNSGNWNSGNWNSGDWNSGDSNSGYRNSGDWNSDNHNSGNWNSGNWNSGNWNSGNWNSGYLNIDKPLLRIFGKETNFKLGDIGDKLKFPDYFYFNLAEWVEISEMTEEEKKKYPHYSVTTGFLRVFKYKEAWKKSFDKAIKKDVALTLEIPNFDYKMFEEISGITKKMIDKKLK